MFCHALYLAYKLTGYEHTQGIVVQSGVHTRKTSRGPIVASWTAYVLEQDVKYQYSVRSVRYVGTNIRGLEASNANSLLPSELAALKQGDGTAFQPHYREGARVDVWYDPARPNRAVLDKTIDWGVIGILGIFLVLTAIPNIIFARQFLMMRRGKIAS